MFTSFELVYSEIFESQKCLDLVRIRTDSFRTCYYKIMVSTDKRIDNYIKKQSNWQQKICEEIRRLVHLAEPEITETIKRTDRPSFTFNGNVCAFQATKDHVNIFIYDPTAPDPEKIINQGNDNLTARAIQIYQEDKINEKAFLNLIKAVVSNNRAGGWRKL